LRVPANAVSKAAEKEEHNKQSKELKLLLVSILLLISMCSFSQSMKKVESANYSGDPVRTGYLTGILPQATEKISRAGMFFLKKGP